MGFSYPPANEVRRLLLTTDTTYLPTGFGPAESAQPSALTTTLTRTIVYTYDNLYRLTNATYSTGEVFTYTYDPAGNRTTQTTLAGTTVYTYDNANRLTQVNGQSYTYDTNGNLLNDGLRTFTYDTENRLTSVVSGAATTTFEYNGDGDRYAQTVNGVTTDYVLDPVGLAQVLMETTGGQSKHYLPGLAQYDATNGWQYVTSDRVGSVRLLVKPNGEVALSQSFDPFGNVLERTGAGQSSFGYTGEQADPTGLVFLRARYYNPAIGRFITADSIIPDPMSSQGWNRYAYAGNNSTNYIDPSGHCWGPMSFLRNTPYYDTTCDNLDMAILVAGHPEATAYEKAQAVAYVEAVAISHLVLGEALVMLGYEAYAAISSACAAACADGDCTNEAGAAARLWKYSRTFYDASLDPRTKGSIDALTGDIRINPSLSRLERLQTLYHERVHRFFMPNGPLEGIRRQISHWAYSNSALLRYAEEAIAETRANQLTGGSLIQGLLFPIREGYVDPEAILIEGILTGVGIGYSANKLASWWRGE